MQQRLFRDIEMCCIKLDLFGLHASSVLSIIGKRPGGLLWKCGRSHNQGIRNASRTFVIIANTLTAKTERTGHG